MTKVSQRKEVNNLMKKILIRVGLLIIVLILLIPIKKDIPSKYLCKCLYDSHKIYKAGFYTYVKKDIYKLNEHKEVVLDKTVKKIFWWPFNNWEKINGFVIAHE